jgi:hypothetical protein
MATPALVRRPVSRAELWVTLAACAYVVFLALATTWWTYDIWGALLVGPLLLAVSIPPLRRVAAADGTQGLFSLMVAALVVKLLMAVPRWGVAFVFYDRAADATAYDHDGKLLAPMYRTLVFPAPVTPGGAGTHAVSAITGGVYAVIGPSVIAGFMVFSWLGFWGLVGCFRAARIALPDLDAKRYAALIFFLPSMTFWPSAIGKDAIICLGIGAAVYGAARMYSHRRFGIPMIAVGLAVTFAIRPHITALLAASISAGFLALTSRRRTPITPLLKAVGIALIAVASLVVVSKAATSLGVDDSASLSKELAFRGGQTEQGGSAFQAHPIRSPSDVPMATLTVLFRPFPWEATSSQVLIAAAEGSFLLALTLLSLRRVRGALGYLKEPYMIMALLYLAGFIFAFSQFGNFGILARQRVQGFPFFLLFLSMPPLARRGGARSRSDLHATSGGP